MGPAERAIEVEVQRVLQSLLGGTVVERDTGGAQGLRDFDLVDDDAVRHSVEVTSVQLPEARATRSELERLREMALGLTASWGITVEETAAVKPIEKEAPALLNDLYSRGVTTFNELEPCRDPAEQAAVDALASLRIAMGRVLVNAQPPRLLPSGWGSGSIDAANLTTAVNEEAAKADNRRKLAAAPEGATRHLFVWLHDSHWYVAAPLRDLRNMPPAPTLPDEIDSVWVAVSDGTASGVNCGMMIRSDGAGWARIDPP